MDIATLAASAVAILTPYLSKGADALASALGKKVGKEASEAGSHLLNLLRRQFSDDKEASEQLTKFEDGPELHASALESVLLERLKKDRKLAGELREFLADTAP